MKIIPLEPITIQEIESKLGIELEIRERPYPCGGNKYYCGFPTVEMTKKGEAVELIGEGTTIDSSIRDICKNLSGEYIILNKSSEKPIKLNTIKVTYPKKSISNDTNRVYKTCGCGKRNKVRNAYCYDCGTHIKGL